MSKIEVNTVAPQCGTTLTLGESGDTVVLGSGASQTGFGRTGTVNWQTGSIKTADFTAVDGQGFFVDTNGGAVIATLPTGSAGSIVSIQDYRNTFDTANCTVQTAGSQKINGGTAAGKVILSTEGEGITLVYIDSTIGWRSIQDNDFASASAIPTFISATGGTVTTVDTNYKVHTFTGPGTFCVSSVGNPAGSNEVSYMVVAGGGAGGTHTNPAGQGASGGGGAGGFREGKTPQCTYTSSPIACTSGSNNGLPVSATSYPIVIGAGGSQRNYPAPANGGDGSNSSFSTITSHGGGGGGRGGQNCAGNAGGSGGGGAGAPGSNAGGSGNTPSLSPAQGTNGGAGKCAAYGGGGGGGATVAGWNATTAGSPLAPTSGTGATTSINGTPTAFAGGGGGGGWASTSATTNAGGAGGGGTGAFGPYPSSTNATAGTTNTGGGGGGSFGSPNADGGAGGSGIVIIRYKFQ